MQQSYFNRKLGKVKNSSPTLKTIALLVIVLFLLNSFVLVHQLSDQEEFQIFRSMRRFWSMFTAEKFDDIGSYLKKFREEITADSDLDQLRALYRHPYSSRNDLHCNQTKMSNAERSGLQVDFEMGFSGVTDHSWIEKTQFDSSSTKVIMIVGLDGVGHNLIRSAMHAFNSPQDVTEQKLFKPFGTYSRFMQCTTHEEAFGKSHNLEKLKIDLKSYNLPVLFVNTVHGSSYMTYPNCYKNTRLHYPNIKRLAQLCEEMNLDFRIVLLNRDPEAVIRRSHFPGNVGTLAKLYSNSYFEIFRQLNRLDPRFLASCFDFDYNAKQLTKSLKRSWKEAVGYNDLMIQKLVSSISNSSKYDPECIIVSGENQFDATYQKQLRRLYREAIVFQKLCHLIENNN